MELVSVERENKIAIVELDHGVTNAINPTLVNELAETLQKTREDSDVHSLVLASANDKFFSIGLDISALFELTREEFGSFYRAFNRACLDLYTLPKPTIAAISGHAIAGGCILALCCDYRFIAQGRKLMGLNEIKLGVPVPYPGHCILQQLVGTRAARQMMESGEFYEPERLLQMGAVDLVVPPERVRTNSLEKAAVLGAFPRAAFGMIKRSRIEAVETQIRTNLPEKERFFIERWYSDEARGRLKEAMKKF